MTSQPVKLSLSLANARSVKGKISEIETLSSMCDILCLTETHIDSSINSNEILGDGKSIYRKDRNLYGGGVLVAIKNDIPHEPIIFSDLTADIEIVGLNIPRDTPSGKDTVLLCFYRPPTQDCLEELRSVLEYLQSVRSGSEIVLVGDFNLPDIQWLPKPHILTSCRRALHQKFLNLLEEFGLKQIVTAPTHVKGNTLDLVCSSNPVKIYDPDVINPGISDHFLIHFLLLVSCKRFPLVKCDRYVKLYGKVDKMSFTESLLSVDTGVQHLISKKADIDSVYGVFSEGLTDAVRQHVPVKKIHGQRNHDACWFNNEARKLINKQKRMFSQYRKTNDLGTLSLYKHTCRENKIRLRSIKRKYFNSKLFLPLQQGNSKKFYAHMKRLKSTGNEIQVLTRPNGDEAASAFDIADTLNDFFTSVFNPPSSYDLAEIGVEEPRIVIGLNGVIKLLGELKNGKAPGPDGLRKEDLVIDLEVTAGILTAIFQYSLDTGAVPSIWHHANITPIFKSGSRKDPANYRPVSLTCIPCKMMEHVVLHELYTTINENLTRNQHGFRKGLSCNTQLASTMDEIGSAVDKGHSVHAVVLDFAKAFDKVSHELLILKLSDLNIEPLLLRWVANFLSNRTQAVVVSGESSEMSGVSSGVPQGSVLGPTLFLVFVNDIVDALSRDTGIKLFADDALVFRAVSGGDSVLAMQRELVNLEGWARRWQMSFNPRKCSVMQFGPSVQPPEYIFCGQVLQIVTSTKYLGVMLHSSLSWDEQITAQVNKGYRVLGMLRRSLYDAPPRVKLIAYLTLCRPLLEYACEVWDPFKKKDIQSLEMVQNRAVRFVKNLRGIVSVSEARDELQLETLEARRRQARHRLLNKIVGGQSVNQKVLDSCFPSLSASPPHDHATRSIGRGVPTSQHINTTKYQNSFVPRTVRELREGWQGQ